MQDDLPAVQLPPLRRSFRKLLPCCRSQLEIPVLRRKKVFSFHLVVRLPCLQTSGLQLGVIEDVLGGKRKLLAEFANF
jgi:hypothetical protein